MQDYTWNWTEEAPTEPGWYFVVLNASPNIMQVTSVGGELWVGTSKMTLAEKVIPLWSDVAIDIPPLT